jgi:hypothetical protein
MKECATSLFGCPSNLLPQFLELVTEPFRRVAAEVCLANARVDKVQNDAASSSRNETGKLLGGHDLHGL